ncbi:MAG: fibronectin type III domain-containing protein [bacterium]|nr:fibronectin type III domain-containing protein [bacterium]
MTARYLPFALLALAAGVLFSCREKITNEHFIPDAPSGLGVSTVTNTTVTLRWQDRSTNETGFIIYRQQASVWSPMDTAAANQLNIEVGPLQSGTTYRFRVTAYNEDGESAPSGEVEAHTTEPQMPNPPTDIGATTISSTIVHVTWTDRGTQDSFLVQRRETATAWAGVGATADNIQEYNDSTCLPQTHYLFRVGAKNQNGTSWSLDSAEATTLPPGAPLPPESLQVTVVLGTGVILVWLDRSSDEALFEIGRGPSLQSLEVRDTVPEGVTTYTDSLRDTVGIYYYGVRAVNDNGYSSWATFGPADYRFCSDGVIPICIGNYWQYRVDSSGGTDFDLRRSVMSVDFSTGSDYYLVGEGPPAGSITDTLYYLRNFSGEGCYVISYPLGESPVPELLYRYPPLPAGSYYYCQRDCVLVLVSSPGQSMIVSGVTYTGVIAFQRFFSPTHSVQYYLKPQTVGIIQEREYRGLPSDPTEACRRNITDYRVQN